MSTFLTVLGLGSGTRLYPVENYCLILSVITGVDFAPTPEPELFSSRNPTAPASQHDPPSGFTPNPDVSVAVPDRPEKGIVMSIPRLRGTTHS